MITTMFEYIIDDSGLPKNPLVEAGLAIDIRRIRSMEHPRMAPGGNAVKVIARPGIHSDSINYEIQYGKKTGDEFSPLGDPLHYSHEMLPFLGRLRG